MLFKEVEATVDIGHLLGAKIDAPVPDPLIDINLQFSNVKDVNYSLWNRYRIKETISAVWDEYVKKQSEIQPFVHFDKPDFSA